MKKQESCPERTRMVQDTVSKIACKEEAKGDSRVENLFAKLSAPIGTYRPSQDHLDGASGSRGSHCSCWCTAPSIFSLGNPLKFFSLWHTSPGDLVSVLQLPQSLGFPLRGSLWDVLATGQDSELPRSKKNKKTNPYTKQTFFAYTSKFLDKNWWKFISSENLPCSWSALSSPCGYRQRQISHGCTLYSVALFDPQPALWTPLLTSYCSLNSALDGFSLR